MKNVEWRVEGRWWIYGMSARRGPRWEGRRERGEKVETLGGGAVSPVLRLDGAPKKDFMIRCSRTWLEYGSGGTRNQECVAISPGLAVKQVLLISLCSVTDISITVELYLLFSQMEDNACIV